MEKFLFGAMAAAFTLCAGFMEADATRGADNPHYSFWFNPLSLGGYVTAAIGVVSLACALGIIVSRVRRRRWVEPESPTQVRSRLLLGEGDLRDIRRISTASRYTRAQKQRLLAPYYGRLIQITGTVVEVGAWTGSTSRVTVRTRLRKFTALMDFSNSDTYESYLSMRALKRRATVIGAIEQIEPDSILLRNCELRDWF